MFFSSVLWAQLYSLVFCNSSSPSFEEFVKTFNKTYSDAEETRSRRQIYESNVAFINAQNSGNNAKYRLAVNAFADLSLKEFRDKHLGGGATFSGRKLGRFSKKHLLGEHIYGGAELPEAVDWTNATTPVKNQESCGSCYAFSATGAIEAREVLRRRAKLGEQEPVLSLSEQQVIDCSYYTGNQGCDGGLMDYVFEYVNAHGICSEEEYQYHAKDGQCKETTCKPVIKAGELLGYLEVSPKDSLALMEALTQGPVSVAIEADYEAFQFYHSGVLTGECGDDLNHGVLAVGYGVTDDGQKFWKLKNSWGASWGDHGYVLVDRSQEGAGECGILLDSSYPVFKGDKLPRVAYHPSADSLSVLKASAPYGPIPCERAEDRPIPYDHHSFCAPPCEAARTCPTAPGLKGAVPMCALVDEVTHERFCILVCKPRADQCQPGADCVALTSNVSVCMFYDPNANWPRGPLMELVYGKSEEDDEVTAVEM